jgi:hypothetical protein
MQFRIIQGRERLKKSYTKKRGSKGIEGITWT